MWFSFSRPLDLPAVPESGQNRTWRSVSPSTDCTLAARPNELHRIARPASDPAPAVTSLEAPHAGARSADLPCRQAQSPWADLQPHVAAHRLRNMTAPMRVASRSVRIAPIPRAPSSRAGHRSETPSDRTLRLNAGKKSQRLYFSEPPSSTASRSRGTDALLAQHTMAGETIPLACW